jgi:hypothetical protein
LLVSIAEEATLHAWDFLSVMIEYLLGREYTKIVHKPQMTGDKIHTLWLPSTCTSNPPLCFPIQQVTAQEVNLDIYCPSLAFRIAWNTDAISTFPRRRRRRRRRREQR